MKSKNTNEMEELPLDDIESDAFDKRMKARERKARKEKEARKEQRRNTIFTVKRAIIGGAELVVVLQLIYTTLYLLGVNLPFYKWMVIPQVVLTAWMLINKFVFNNGES